MITKHTSSHLLFYRIVVLEDLSKFTGKKLYQNLIFNKVVGSLLKWDSSTGVFLWILLDLCSITFIQLQTKRLTDTVCTEPFKVIIFRKKQSMKNASLMNFLFVGSRNWFMIHESQTLNSSSDNAVNLLCDSC